MISEIVGFQSLVPPFLPTNRVSARGEMRFTKPHDSVPVMDSAKALLAALPESSLLASMSLVAALCLLAAAPAATTEQVPARGAQTTASATATVLPFGRSAPASPEDHQHRQISQRTASSSMIEFE